jgi:uncharacterized protein (TIRG00374 family)
MNIRKLLPAIGIVILIYILITIDIEMIILNFSSIKPMYLILSFLSLIPILLITNYEWQFILKKQKMDVSYIYSLKNILIGYFYGFITPGGLGAYTRTFYLQNESGAPIQKCVSNIIILNTVDYISLLLLGIIGGILVSSRFPHLFVLIIIMFIISLALFLLFLRKDTLTNFLNRMLQHKIFNLLRNKFDSSIDSFFIDMPNSRDLLIPFTVSILGWILRFSELYLISKLFSIEIPYIYFILMIAIANVVASLPVTIYGLGTREMTMISLFSIFGISPERIVSLSLFWFVIVWLFPSILGAAIAVKEGGFINKSKPKMM